MRAEPFQIQNFINGEFATALGILAVLDELLPNTALPIIVDAFHIETARHDGFYIGKRFLVKEAKFLNGHRDQPWLPTRSQSLHTDNGVCFWFVSEGKGHRTRKTPCFMHI